MAKMVKAADMHRLYHDTSTLRETAISYVTPHVEYDQEILATSYATYGDNSSLAIALSGTSDKKSNTYKAALRNVQLWKKNQSKPGTKYKRKIINALARKQAIPASSLIDAAGKVQGSATVSITGYVQISNTPAEYRTLHASMDNASFQEFLEAAVSGDHETALSIFADSGGYPDFSVYGSAEDPVRVTLS